MKSTSIYCRIIVITCLLIQTVSAQQVHEPAKAQLIKEWERAKAYTKEYLDAMPADKYSFKAQDSVRSFAGQMLHLDSVVGQGCGLVCETRADVGHEVIFRKLGNRGRRLPVPDAHLALRQ